MSYFALRSIIILMETINYIYKRPLTPLPTDGDDWGKSHSLPRECLGPKIGRQKQKAAQGSEV